MQDSADLTFTLQFALFLGIVKSSSSPAGARRRPKIGLGRAFARPKCELLIDAGLSRSSIKVKGYLPGLMPGPEQRCSDGRGH